MSYNYADHRDHLFTDDGQRMFLKVRDTVNRLLTDAGAFQAERAWHDVSGDSWLMIACLDRLIELGEIENLSSDRVWTQHRIYARPERSTT